MSYVVVIAFADRISIEVRGPYRTFKQASADAKAFDAISGQSASVEPVAPIAGYAGCSAKTPHTWEEGAQCRHCYGKGWNDERKAVDGHYQGAEVFRIECEHCDGSGVAP